MSALLAAAPLAVILVGMGVLRRSAVVAGSVGLVVALVLTATTFDLTDGAPGSELRAGLGAFAEAVHTTATILWIILPAIAIFEFQSRSGAIERIRDTLAALTDDCRIQALLIAWYFALFMEGAAGFGTPVALAAPLLVGLGYTPVKAVTLALLGHAAGVSFGALGTPVLVQVALTGLAAGDVAVRTAGLHALAGPVLLLLMVRLAGDTPLTRSDLALVRSRGSLLFRPVARARLPRRAGVADAGRRSARDGRIREPSPAPTPAPEPGPASAGPRPHALPADPSPGAGNTADPALAAVAERADAVLEPR
jgi:lactate permease